MADPFRRYKTKLRKKYYDKGNTEEEKKRKSPPTVSQDDWEIFVKIERHPDVIKRRAMGKKNRSFYTYGHSTGRTGHAVIKAKLVKANPTKTITRGVVWVKAHTKGDGNVTKGADEHYEKIMKLKETINESDEADLPLEDDILSWVFGKDTRGRTRSVGTGISSTKVKASAPARALLKSSQSETSGLRVRIETMEGTLSMLVGTVNSLCEVIEGTQHGQGPQHGQGIHHEHPSHFFASNELGSSTHKSTSSQNTKCVLVNFDNEMVSTGVVCKDSTAGIRHGHPVPVTHEKVLLDCILLPAEKTAKENHHFAEIFGEVCAGGHVVYPKFAIQYS